MIPFNKTILFVNSYVPLLERGWVSKDVKDTLNSLGISTDEIFLSEESDIKKLIPDRDHIIVWPMSLTIGSSVEGPFLVYLLNKYQIPFIGPYANSISLCSKLKFKNNLLKFKSLSSPSHLIINESTDLNSICSSFGFPSVLKTEYSYNSLGVRVINNATELNEGIVELKKTFNQKLFIEKWERYREFTVAYLPKTKNKSDLSAALELKLKGNKQIIDSEVKNNNKLLSLILPEKELLTILETSTLEVAKKLGVNGHFRLDYLMNKNGELFLSEINVIPFLSLKTPQISYFPLAFNLSKMISYKDIIKRIVFHAYERLPFKDSVKKQCDN